MAAPLGTLQTVNIAIPTGSTAPDEREQGRISCRMEWALRPADAAVLVRFAAVDVVFVGRMRGRFELDEVCDALVLTSSPAVGLCGGP